MKNLSPIFWSGLVILCCGSAFAATNSIKDPQVIVAGDDGSFPVGSEFSFISPSGTSPVSLPNGSPCVVAGISVPLCLFQNVSGFGWGTLTFTISPRGQTGPFSCTALAYFTGCSFNEAGTQVIFFGGTGIAVGHDFVVEVIGWAAGSKFDGEGAQTQGSGTAFEGPAQGTPTSKPGNVALFLDNHVALVERRRLRIAVFFV